MNKTNLILVGGGGHCHSVIECIEQLNEKYEILGISDIPQRLGEIVYGYPIMTTDNEIPFIKSKPFKCVITIGQIKSAKLRVAAFNFLRENEIGIETIIDQAAMVSSRSTIGEGTVILRQAFINSGVSIGNNCIINTRALIEHDSFIGNHVHISTGSIINGDCVIGDGCFIGSGAIISNGVKIAPDTIIGAGTVILKDIKQPGTYLGNPGRRIL